MAPPGTQGGVPFGGGMGSRFDPIGQTPASGSQPWIQEGTAPPQSQEELMQRYGGGMGQQPFTPPQAPQMPPPSGGFPQYGSQQTPGFNEAGIYQDRYGMPIMGMEQPTQQTNIQWRGEGAPPGTQGGVPGQPPTGQPGTSAQPGEGGFPYPEQWGQAGDIYGQLAGGMPGMPDPGAIWGGYQQQAGDLSRELAEQAGMGVGGRYGSALQRNIADVGMRAGERFGGEMERMRMGDIQGQRQAMLGAAGGLSGLGGAQAMLPGQLAGQAMGLGGQYQGMQQQEYDRQMQEFMRTQPEYSPYLPYMQQGAQVPYGPQTYSPGFGSNMMDIGQMMGMYGMMGGQDQSWLTKPW